MGEVITIGLDIAKSVFQIHGVDGDGAVVIRKRVSRGKVLEFFADLSPCLVGIEACPTAHHSVANRAGWHPYHRPPLCLLHLGRHMAAWIWAGAAAELDRRQGSSGRFIKYQARQSLLAMAALSPARWP